MSPTNKTTIVISHRLTSVKGADKILYPGTDGRLSVFESYNELLDSRVVFEEVFGTELFE